MKSLIGTNSCENGLSTRHENKDLQGEFSCVNNFKITSQLLFQFKRSKNKLFLSIKHRHSFYLSSVIKYLKVFRISLN